MRGTRGFATTFCYRDGEGGQEEVREASRRGVAIRTYVRRVHLWSGTSTGRATFTQLDGCVP